MIDGGFLPMQVTANMGPDFSYPPTDVQYRPVSPNSSSMLSDSYRLTLLLCLCLVQMSEAAGVSAEEQTMSELLFHVESAIARDSPPL